MRKPSQRVAFEGTDGCTLAARLDVPAQPPVAYALFAHCFTCSKDLVAAGRIAAALNGQGIAVLRFDFTGLGASEGDFGNTDFSSNVDDLVHAAAWLRDHHRAPQLLVGHSLGGAAVLSAARRIPEVAAVATIGAPSDTEHVAALLADDAGKIRSDGQATVVLGGRSFTISEQFLDDLAEHRVVDCAAELDAALMVLHSPIDNVVGIEHAGRIYQAARHPKSFVSLDGADHLLSEGADAEFAARMIGAWAMRYLVDDRPGHPAPPPTDAVIVAETGQGTFLNHVVARGHQFLADEPESAGGFDAGPSPYDLLASALGACTTMTMRMYADRKRLPLDRATVEVRHGKVHIEATEGTADGTPTQIDRFERIITLEGEGLTDDDRERIVSIANRCPVHRTLSRSSTIETVLR
jgi:uncharacterized OsmC-like protein/alpha/beta superfamily hydrolase